MDALVCHRIDRYTVMENARKERIPETFLGWLRSPGPMVKTMVMVPDYLVESKQGSGVFRKEQR